MLGYIGPYLSFNPPKGILFIVTWMRDERLNADRHLHVSIPRRGFSSLSLRFFYVGEPIERVSIPRRGFSSLSRKEKAEEIIKRLTGMLGEGGKVERIN